MTPTIEAGEAPTAHRFTTHYNPIRSNSPESAFTSVCISRKHHPRAVFRYAPKYRRHFTSKPTQHSHA